jgi:hypothetical protein
LRDIGCNGDLRKYNVLATRTRGAGAPHVVLQITPETPEYLTPHEYQDPTVEYLRRWWVLPAELPDYRKEVWNLSPWSAPRLRAPSFADMQARAGVIESPT